MSISRNDPFDLTLCMRGLAVLITYMHSDVYEYVYFFTFKKTMKSYAKDFNNPWEQPIEHGDFFDGIKDPFVWNALKAERRLVEGKHELALRFGIAEIEDLMDEQITMQAERFKPFRLVFKRSKSYKKLKTYYERTLSAIIDSLYLYACALTAQSYKIPLVLKRQFNLSQQEGLRLLNHDDPNVQLLANLIDGLRADLERLSVLNKI
ncbi:hypothetical protein [Pedobacter nutrimenti]|uniref:Uncharacterized protein n=1 Tax=Pedobacter nutrimenti TaxID=1241337 RepID=A0A318UF77_9SPHI|nr:hypothetical protein [Pedobacter nutrimenti]PYF74753.1 hypothetical protein B0O44_103199 [Pedobacter nutrimenti]